MTMHPPKRAEEFAAQIAAFAPASGMTKYHGPANAQPGQGGLSPMCVVRSHKSALGDRRQTAVAAAMSLGLT